MKAAVEAVDEMSQLVVPVVVELHQFAVGRVDESPGGRTCRKGVKESNAERILGFRREADGLDSHGIGSGVSHGFHSGREVELPVVALDEAV